MRSVHLCGGVAIVWCVAVGTPGFSAPPCKGTQGTVVQHGRVVHPTVIHERVISSTPVREVALAQVPADIVDTAVGAGTFKTLAAALGAADLVATLKGTGPFTVFAPTDEAFAKLGKDTIADLLKPENKAKLASILTYHVVAGNVKAADVVKLTEAKTVNGQSVKISVANGGVKVDGANVVTTDIAATNGTIHVIDAVILPK